MDKKNSIFRLKIFISLILSLSLLYFCEYQKSRQWGLHNCGNTTEATTLLQQFIKKKTIRRENQQTRFLGDNSDTSCFKIL